MKEYNPEEYGPGFTTPKSPLTPLDKSRQEMSELYDSLTIDQRNALYYGMSPEAGSARECKGDVVDTLVAFKLALELMK